MNRLGATVIAIVVLTGAIVGCGQSSPSESVTALEAVVPVLERLEVTNFWVDDRCEYIAYERGAFVTDPTSFDCEIDVEGPHPRVPIDEQARADIALIKTESSTYGPTLQHAFP